MTEYWGDQWLEVERLLRPDGANSALDGVLVNWSLPPSVMDQLREVGLDCLDGRDRYMEELQRMALAAYDFRYSTYPYSEIVNRICGVRFGLDAGYGVRRVVEAAVARACEDLNVPMVELERRRVVDRVMDFHAEHLSDLLEALDAIAATLDGRIRAAIAFDLNGVTADRPPETGQLFLGPLIGRPRSPIPSGDVDASRFVLTLYLGYGLDMEVNERVRLTNHWVGVYSLNTRDVTSLRADVEYEHSECIRISDAILQIVMTSMAG